jgi:pyruvate formate lyase activating enzyme
MMKKAMLWEKAEDNRVICGLCAHRCAIDDGDFGFCGMRKNKAGELYTFAYGNVIASHVDPIEKKPLYHFLPGTYAYSVATIGCNFRCSFCQNWNISQVSAKNEDMEGYEMKPEEIVREAEKRGCRSISYTYTEPTVFFEYALDTARIARDRGISNSFVTNGYMTAEAVEEIRPYLDAVNVDLKFFKDSSYRKICGARLDPVIRSIENLKKAGIWVEVTTLIVPGENDSEKELRDIAGFLAGVGKEIPWHISRFHPDYKYTSSHPTPVDIIKKAAEIGREEGLKYIYMGNVPDAGKTQCPSCGKTIIDRSGFSAGIEEKPFIDGKCSFCGELIEGIWR